MKTSSFKSFAFAILASAVLVACGGGGKSGNGGYDPNYGVVGPMDRNSVPAQKLMSTAWCSDYGTARAFLFSQTGDLHIEKLSRGWERSWRGFDRGRRRGHGGGGPNYLRGTWGLQDLQLFIRAPGLNGVYAVDMGSRPDVLVLRTSAAPDGMGPGAIRLRACGGR